MDRRAFLRGLVGGVATDAAVRTFPFRVFSFPSKPSSAFSVVTHKSPWDKSLWETITARDLEFIEARPIAPLDVGLFFRGSPFASDVRTFDEIARFCRSSQGG
jgi:hypothetical protein